MGRYDPDRFPYLNYSKVLPGTVLSNFLIVLLVVEFGTDFFQATATQAVVIAGGDIRQLRRTQHHRLALAKQNRAGFALKLLAAPLTGFGFVFGHCE